MAEAARRWPAPLAAGATIAVVAPSGPADEERVGLGSAVLASWGFQVRLGPHVLGRHDDLPYLSAPDQTRADDLETAWCDPTVDAVWAARGGYGTQRMVNMIEFNRLRAAGPKTFVGFSDVTALHSRIGRELGQVTVHGPVVGSLAQLRDPETVRALRCLLEDPPESGLVLVRGRAAVPGEDAGRLWGGNLSLLTADVGTEPPPTDPVIMVLEEVGESGYRVDRMLTQLLRAGWMAAVAGVVLGDLGQPVDLLEAIVLDRLRRLGIPVLTRVPVGHGDQNLGLPLGAQVRLKVGAEVGQLTLA